MQEVLLSTPAAETKPARAAKPKKAAKVSSDESPAPRKKASRRKAAL
jgi:hypothetical protein